MLGLFIINMAASVMHCCYGILDRPRYSSLSSPDDRLMNVKSSSELNLIHRCVSECKIHQPSEYSSYTQVFSSCCFSQSIQCTFSKHLKPSCLHFISVLCFSLFILYRVCLLLNMKINMSPFSILEKSPTEGVWKGYQWSVHVPQPNIVCMRLLLHAAPTQGGIMYSGSTQCMSRYSD